MTREPNRRPGGTSAGRAKRGKAGEKNHLFSSIFVSHETDVSPALHAKEKAIIGLDGTSQSVAILDTANTSKFKMARNGGSYSLSHDRKWLSRVLRRKGK